MNPLGWKTDVSKKVIETVVINIALMAAQELFKEGLAALKSKLRKPPEDSEEAEEETEGEDTSDDVETCEEDQSESEDEEAEEEEVKDE